MKKVLFSLIMSLVFLFSSTPVLAAQNVEPFKKDITVTADGGKYQVGFITVEFKKNFLEPDMLPITFSAEIYAENGQAYIQFSPGTPEFYKKVHLKGDAFKGYIYDKETGKDIYVTFKHNQILAEHFSRYIWID